MARGSPALNTPVAELVDRMLAGDRVALAKLMSRAENEAADVPAIMARLAPRCGGAYVIGVTGPPGAGKSTLVDRLVERERLAGGSVGVIAVDPSSPFSGGAVLGDRIRMQSHALDPGVFIRSLSTRGRRGGIARATRHVARLFDAFGKNTIVIETVGVGQTELDIMELARTVVVVLVPEAGDTVQVMKAGLLEIAHVFVVNKADREGAARMKTELDTMLQLRPNAAWTAPVVLTEATRDRGIDELAAAIAAHRRQLASDDGALAAAERQREREFLDVLGAALRDRLAERIGSGYGALVARVRSGEQDPYIAALEVLGDSEGLRRLVGGD